MKVLVTGATGFVGQEVVRELHESGHQIWILARHGNSRTARGLAERYGAEVRVSDVTEARGLREAAEGAEGVIHLVGIISEVGHSTFEQVHTRGTQHIVDAAKSVGVRRFVHMSALGTRPGARSRYHQSKWAAEEYVRQSGLGYTIFRPSLIFGPRDHFVNLFARIIRLSPFLPVMGSGQTCFQPVAVETVAAAFVRALSEPRAAGQTFDLVGPERFTFNELLDQILGVMGRNRLKLHVPLGLARVQAVMLEGVFGQLLHRPPPLNRDQLLMLQEDNVGNEEPASSLLGLEPVHFKEGITRYLARSA